jgi:tRNA pseudouridine38-40 synthase
MRYKLHIAYDGTEYHGWQYQQDIHPTIAGVLERSFTKTFFVPLSLVGASRTDKGVHAYDQVARCTTDLDMDPARMMELWNRVLPSSIVIREMTYTSEGFHPQHNVVAKTYWYHVFFERPLPFLARYGWHVGNPHLDSEKLRACLTMVQGTHDFRSFCTGNELVDTIRTITNTSLTTLPKFHAYRIAIEGPSFLYRMVRRIVGSAVYVASHPQLSPEDFYKVFTAHNPEHSLPTAPAHGLLLRKIRYNNLTD